MNVGIKGLFPLLRWEGWKVLVSILRSMVKDTVSCESASDQHGHTTTHT